MVISPLSDAVGRPDVPPFPAEAATPPSVALDEEEVSVSVSSSVLVSSWLSWASTSNN